MSCLLVASLTGVGTRLYTKTHLYADTCRHRHTIGAETSAIALTYIFMHTRMHAHAHTHARVYARAHTNTHTHTDAKVFSIGHVINIHIGMPN